jgi:hypothetical protein|tara:strand:- start:471 stop:974 length:504 start_codon:yes stop_codon:yes gene_type:complete
MTEDTKELKNSKEDLQAIQRTSRAKTTRNAATRRKPWQPPSMLDAPPAPEGFKHRWIRAEVRGFDDRQNISAKLREGYELVRKDEYPDFEAPVIETGKHEGVFGVGGLLLARIPLETVEERTEYFKKRHTDQLEAVDHDMMRENAHSTMSITKPDRQSRVTFGGPRK